MNTNFMIVLFLLFCMSLTSCGREERSAETPNGNGQISAAGSPEITFVELGSVTCIPCRQMQPIMKSIEEKFGNKVKVVFHDVWKDKDARKRYNIDLIPTQVFLDSNGNEFYRHQGFFAENEIIKLFESRGVRPQNN